MSRNYQNHPELYPSVREQQEAEYQSAVNCLFMTYDCEDPEDQKIIQRKLKELNERNDDAFWKQVSEHGQ